MQRPSACLHGFFSFDLSCSVQVGLFACFLTLGTFMSYWIKRNQSNLPLGLMSFIWSIKKREKYKCDQVHRRFVVSVQHRHLINVYKQTNFRKINTHTPLPQAIITRLSEKFLYVCFDNFSNSCPSRAGHLALSLSIQEIWWWSRWNCQ